MALETADIERLKEIFMPRNECQQQTDNFERKLSNDSVRLAVIETKLGQITWLLGAALAVSLRCSLRCSLVVDNSLSIW